MSCFRSLRLPWLLIGLVAGSHAAIGQDKLFPVDAVVNVTLPPYSAVPDDGKDDTAAIQKAITDNVDTGRSVYFPAGTYDISDTLFAKNKDGVWRAHVSLQGQSREKSILRLVDAAAGFSDPTKPKAVYMTGSHWEKGDGLDGGGNKAFRNNIRDLTFDIGKDNRGAIAIDWAPSNQGTIRDVVIVDRSGQGRTGISMRRRIPGPGYIRDVQVRGFDTGLDLGDMQYGVTLENVEFTQQTGAGIRLGENLLYAMDVRATSVKAEEMKSFLLAINSKLGRVAMTGHGKLVNSTGIGPRNKLRTKPLIEPETAPNYWNSDLAEWQAVGPRVEGEPDDTAAIQRAIDAGKPVVYFPIGRQYFLSDTVTIRGKVRHVLGMGSEISLGAAKEPFSNKEQPRPLFRVTPVEGEDVTLENMFFNAQYPGEVLIENKSPKTLVIKHSMGWVGSGAFKRSYQNTPSANGKVFIEDVFLPGWSFRNQQVWARQFNPENQEGDGVTPQVINNGGTLWILGFKTEGVAPFLSTTGGGTTELLGGYNYISATAAPTVPKDSVPYIIEDSKASLTFMTENFRDSDYAVYIRETRDGAVTDVKPTQLQTRNWRDEDRSYVVTLYRTR